MGKINLSLFSLTFLFFLVVHSNAAKSNAAKDWCIARFVAGDARLQAIQDYCCGQVDCSAIQPGGPCFKPDTVYNHASWALNQYYRAKGVCLKLGDLSTTAITTPSHGSCQYA
ncbi:major pollen allergen Ole e 10-like [Actinidia eriantha]|uniref:major pollen allergen Ole e 10-like n=1 Tax=Actinidia eriantha TaxID=165200 RepID=UPI002588E89B|nr:major pollen allergen Ole e 10-like [Actinidia eriantha]